MISPFYTAATGALETQKGMDVVANNIANVNTTGFKRDKGTFLDLVYTNIRPGQEEPSTLEKGHGTRLGKVDTVFTRGEIQKTGNKTDFAITDETSLYAVETTDGVKYTRGGAFHTSLENGIPYLVSSSGNGYVLNQNGQRIVATDEALEAGNLPIGLFTFANLGGLSKEAGTYFVPTENSGAAQAVQNPEQIIKQGSLEGSTVDISQEMTDMIVTQRSFQFNTKMVQTADEIMQTVNSLR